MKFTLSLLPDVLAVCRLPAGAALPDWAAGGNLLVFVWTEESLSLVCPAAGVPEDAQAERGWRALKVQGPLDFSLVGVLAELAGVLADAGVSIFAVSSFETDYVLVKESWLEGALHALRRVGHRVVG